MRRHGEAASLGVAKDSCKERIFWLVDCVAVTEVGKDKFEGFPSRD